MHKEHLLPGDFSIVWQLSNDSPAIHQCLLLYAHILHNKNHVRRSMFKKRVQLQSLHEM